jgi:hypothetical protein
LCNSRRFAELDLPILKGEIPEKTAYRHASDEGRTLTETRFAT